MKLFHRHVWMNITTKHNRGVTHLRCTKCKKIITAFHSGKYYISVRVEDDKKS